MATTDFTLQTHTKPAFENIVWSRPQRKASAGKLLIVGGHKSEFADTQAAFSAALEASVGELKVCLPRSLEQIIGEHSQLFYVDETPSGSFAEAAYDELNAYAQWADGVLLPGELSGNSETELVITKLLQKSNKPVIVSGDAKQLVWRNLEQLPAENISLICNYKQLQQLIIAQSLAVMIKRDDPLATIRDNIRELQAETGLQLVVAGENNIFVAAYGELSQTQADLQPSLPALAAVLALQFPKKQFEALTTAVYLSVTDN